MAGITSSSSAASADDPRVVFGLGDLRGDPEVDDPASPEPEVSPAPGRAIGATCGRATGPGPVSGWTGTDERLPEPGARGVLGFGGGPIGEGGTPPFTIFPPMDTRGKGGSKAPGAGLNARPKDGGSELPGCCCCNPAAPKGYETGGKLGKRGDMVDGGSITWP